MTPAKQCFGTSLLIACAVLVLVVARTTATAGTGTFAGGGFDYCVSVRFDATAAQLTAIRTQIQGGSDVVLDATDTQHRFRNVYVVNDSRASSAAETWILSGAGRAFATYGKYGTRGEHATLYYGSNITGTTVENYTVAHEFAHHAYSVADEYAGPTNANAICLVNPPNPATLNACLMDNYYTRGGMSAAPTLNEFCVKANHDPDKDTFQESINKQSCWETVAGARFAITAPAGLPVDAAPASQAVNFAAASAQKRFVLIIDRSGSVKGGKLTIAKRAATQFIRLLRDGDGLAVLDFDDKVHVTRPFATITTQAQRTAARNAVNALKPGRLTGIGGALLKGIDVIQALPDFSCQTIFVLLSDGMSNSGPAPSAAIPFLNAKLISVLSVALGKDADVRTMTDLATKTGGKLYRAEKVNGVQKIFTDLAGEARDGGIVGRSPGQVNQAGQVQVPIDVDVTTTQTTFVLNWEDVADDLDLSLVDPGANVITLNDVGPGIEFDSGPGFETFVIDNPTPGQWTMVIDGVSTTGPEDFLADAFSESTRTGVAVATDEAEVSYPDAIHVEATPFVDLPIVGATLSADVRRPDGSSVPVTLFDDGNPLHGDTTAGDGVYSTLFSAYTSDGTYVFDLDAANQTGTVYPGEDLFQSASVSPNSGSAPAFERLTSLAVLVSNVPAPPPPAVDHFQCYETRRAAFLIPGVSLEDQFGSSTVDVGLPDNLCAPADKNGEDLTAPSHATHLMDYTIKQTTPFSTIEEQLVVNQFGNIVVDVTKPTRLMVPTAKSPSGPPGPLSSTTDHFKCYRIRLTRGSPRFTPITGVQVADQFGSTTVDLVKPLRLCAPADKNGETPGAEDHPNHLLCYRTRPAASFGDATVFVDNQFGSQVWNLIRRTDFCVPSLKNPMATTTTVVTTTSTTTTMPGSPSGAFVD